VRDVAAERLLGESLADSSARLGAFLADPGPAPPQQAQRAERLLRVASAVESLTQDQRDVVVYHHLLGTPVAQVAREMGRSERAVAGLLYRARRRLAELLGPEG
jgi:RNA polymerase sigma-70 factor (ECF subfamily)